MSDRRGRALIAATVCTAAVALTGALGSSAGQAAGGAKGLRLAPIGNFKAPVYVDNAPEAPKLLFVVEQPGTIRVLRGGKELHRPFLDIRDRVRYAGEQGLLSVAFDPHYARNRRFYVYYVNNGGNVEVDGFRRKRSDATRAEARSRHEVISIPHPTYENHNGGQLQFGPDGLLYMGTGDGGSAGDPDGNAQNPNVLLGKLLRIDPKPKHGYTTPRSNPFKGRGGRDEIYALGLRNPFRFSFDSRSHDIYIGDVGQDEWEEIDHVSRRRLAGANFGWDILEGTHPYEGGGAPARYVPPVLEYSHDGGRNCAVTGGYVIRDHSLGSFYGRYIYGDYCGGQIRSFDPHRPGPSDAATGLDLAQVSSFGEGAHGRIYVASLAGSVSRIVRR